MEEVVFQSLFFVVFVYCCQKGTKTVGTMLKDQPRMNCIEEIVGKFWIWRVISETKNKFTCDKNQVDGNEQHDAGTGNLLLRELGMLKKLRNWTRNWSKGVK